MRLIPWTTLSALIDGDDLVVAVVSGGIGGARARTGLTLNDFLSMPVEEARRALATLRADAASQVVLTVPLSWCSLRAVPFGVAKWMSARTEILSAIERLLPLSPDDAMVGLVETRLSAASLAQESLDGAAASTDGSGVLIGVRRSQVLPWVEQLGRVLGRPVSAVISTPGAVLGLGLQDQDQAEVIDELAGGLTVRHSLSRGVLTEIAAPIGFGDGPTGASRVALSGVGDACGGRRLAPADLALAAALAPEVASGMIAPLDGKLRGAPKRWVLPAAAAVLAAICLAGAQWTSDARFHRAIEQLAEERRAIEAPYKQVERARTETLRLAALIDKGVNRNVSQWESILPPLAAANAALPRDSFLYRIELDPRTVTMRGEAKRAAEVLRKLEDTAEFKGAKSIDPESPVVERGLETFTAQAERDRAVKPASKGGAQ